MGEIKNVSLTTLHHQNVELHTTKFLSEVNLLQ
jgi:hypothetical protein